jgi:hypothetical protein
MTSGPEGERSEVSVPARPPGPWYRRSVFVVLAALAVALVLNVIEANLVERDPVSTASTHRGRPWNDLDPGLDDIVLSVVVFEGMYETQTDPAAWSHVTEVPTFGPSVDITVDTESKALVERICEQARRYMYSPNPYGPKMGGSLRISRHRDLLVLRGKNDACVADRGQ